MATTLRYIVYDIIEALKQTGDDREVQPSQVAYWVIALANRIKAQHIEKRDSGAFLTTFTNVPVVNPTTTAPIGIVQNRKYIVLPATIFDFDKDNAIEYMAYVSDGSPGCPPEFTYTTFTRTSPAESRYLYWNPYTKPSPSNPYFYRTEQYLVLLGVEKVSVKGLELGIYMPIKPVNEIDLDAPFEFPEELIQVLQRNVLDLGRFVLMVPQDKSNDGSSGLDASVPTQKIVSVNEQPQQ